MGSNYLKLFTLSVVLFSVTAQVYQTNPQENQGQLYPNYYQDPSQPYQLPYQQYQQPNQQYQLPYQQYPQYGYGYPQYQPFVSEQYPLPYQYQQPYQPYQQPYQQYQQPYQQYQQPYQQNQPYTFSYGYPQYQPGVSEGRQPIYANSYPSSVIPSDPSSNLPIIQNSTVLPSQNNITNPDTNTTDPFANVKTEIIDVDPQYFNYIMRYHNLQPQVQAQSIRTVPRSTYRYRPTYNITVGTNQFNYTSVPEIIKKHDVQHKTFSFKKTYVITPENRNQKINLNFVNGVPVTDTAEAYKEEVTEPMPVTESEIIETTTEDENPDKPSKQIKPDNRRFIEVPTSCPEGTRYVEGVGCFKKFSLNV